MSERYTSELRPVPLGVSVKESINILPTDYMSTLSATTSFEIRHIYIYIYIGERCLLALPLSLLQARFHAGGDGGLVGRETLWCSVNGDVAFQFRAGGKTGAADIGSSTGAARRVVEGARLCSRGETPFPHS